MLEGKENERKDAVDGKHEEGYKYLAHYTEEFKAKNLGSVTFITWDYQGPAKNPISSICSSVLVFQLQHSNNSTGL